MAENNSNAYDLIDAGAQTVYASDWCTLTVKITFEKFLASYANLII